MLKNYTSKALQSLITVVFAALIIFLPSIHFMPKVIVWFSDGQRILELLLLIIILLNAALIDKKNSLIAEHKLSNNYLNFAFIALLGFTAISAGLAESPRHAVIEVSTFAALGCFALYIKHLYQQNKILFVKKITYALWVSITLYMVSFYIGYITACVYKIPLNWPQPFNGFSNIRSFNQYQLWSLGLICLPLLAFNLKKSISALAYLGLISWWVLLFYSASRGVIIAWLVGMLISAIIYRKLAWPFLRLQLISVFLGYGAYYFLFQVMPHLLNSSLVTGSILRETTSDRIELWNQAIILVKNSPWFGVGPMHFAWNSATNAHPHNTILQLAAEWGVPATLIILTIAVYGFYCWLKKFNFENLKSESKLDSNLTVILCFTIITNSAYSLVDGVIVMPVSQVLMFTTIGLLIGHYFYNDSVSLKSNSFINPIYAALILISLACSTYPEVLNGISGKEKGFSMGYSALGPRYWKEIK
ncbi:MAG TPA: O-antigen ligase family protein [Methylotenera sp.]|nr:O-antigen ligase family protein [Methylotenera sp.]